MTITYPKAFSIELNDVIEPDEAYEFSLQNKLHDKKAFKCSERCGFLLTLTNFGNKNYIHAPHFTPGKREQIHTNCDLMVRRKERRDLAPSEKNRVFTRDKSNIKVDMDFTKGLLSKIASGTHKTSSETGVVNTKLKQTKSKKKSHSTEQSETDTVLKSLKKLIDYYHDFKEGELLTFSDMSNNPLNLDQIFTELSPNFEIKDNSPKIYFGLATVVFRDDVKRPYFNIKFKNEVSFENVLGRPSKNINEADANVQGSKNKVNRLKRFAKSKEEFLLYYFGGFKIHSYNENFYINFDKDYGEEIKYIFIP